MGGWSPEKVGRQKPFRFHFPKAILSSSCPTAQNLPLASFCLSTKFELLYPATESSATGLNSTYHPLDFREYRLTHTHSSSVLPVRKMKPKRRTDFLPNPTHYLGFLICVVLYYHLFSPKRPQPCEDRENVTVQQKYCKPKFW